MRALAKDRGYFNPHRLMVSEYLVSYQVSASGAGGTMAITPGKYEYLAKITAMERGMVASRGQDSLDSLKQEAKDRVQKTHIASRIVSASLKGTRSNLSRHEALR